MAAGRSAVAAANLNLVQAAIVLGVVISTTAHAALDVAVYIVLIHGLRPSFIVDGLSMASPNIFIHNTRINFSFLQIRPILREHTE